MKKFFKIGCLGLIAIIVIIVLIAIFTGGDDDSTNGPSKVESNQEGNNDESKEKEIEETEFGVGEKVELNGQVIEVTEVEKSQGGEFEEPSEGNEFVIVHVSIENNGDDEISYNPYNFKMKNSNGQIEDQGLLMIDNDTALSSGELAPGGNVSGSLSFEQPVDDDGLQLIFEPGFWNTDQIIFNLSKK